MASGPRRRTARSSAPYNGDLNKINSISVANGEVTWVIETPQDTKNPAKFVYKAKLVGGKLEGAMTRDGQSMSTPVHRRPRPRAGEREGRRVVEEGQADRAVQRQGPQRLARARPDVEMKWTVTDGVLKNAPPTTDIVSDQNFWNFDVHVEFKIVEHSNSGIGLRGRYEIQVLEDYGKPAGTHGAAALYARVAPSVNASKPAGEWQSYDIRLVGRDLTVVHNGKKVLDHVHVDGLTAIANNANEGEPGPFIVQGDHSNIEIRKFTVTPLTK